MMLVPRQGSRSPRPEPGQESSPMPEPRIVHEEDRVPFPELADFEALTARALDVAQEVGGIFAAPLRHLADCRPMPSMAREQERGASYKRLAYIAHLAGMSKDERTEWYRIAECIPLADRHAGHLLSKLKRRAT
jgi:hypothetical protein